MAEIKTNRPRPRTVGAQLAAGARKGSAATPPKDMGAADYFGPMPTMAEVLGRGFPKEKWQEIYERRNRLIAQFNADPVFRAEVKAAHAEHMRNLRDEAAE